MRERSMRRPTVGEGQSQTLNRGRGRPHFQRKRVLHYRLPEQRVQRSGQERSAGPGCQLLQNRDQTDDAISNQKRIEAGQREVGYLTLLSLNPSPPSNGGEGVQYQNP